MKILTLHIHSFGKLQNQDVNFRDGINVFRQNNGFGKTTLANFIRAMLYGFDKKNRTGKYDAASVSAWENWDNSARTGGTMVVQHNGAVYRIERIFDGSAKGVTVTNDSTKKPVALPDGMSVGEYFLGLTAEGYDRSAYFPQEAIRVMSDENLNQRLSGLVENSSADYTKIHNALVEYNLNIVGKRSAAEMTKLTSRQTELERQLQKREEAARQLHQADVRLQQIEHEQQQTEQRILQLTEQSKKLQKTVHQSALGEGQIAAQQKADQLHAKLSRLEGFEQDKIACDELLEKIKKTPEVAKKQRRVHLPLLFGGVILAVAGIGVCFAQLIAGLCMAAVGAVLAVISAFVKPSFTTLPSGEKDVYITEYFRIASKYVYCENCGWQDVAPRLWKAYNDYVGDKREYQALVQSLPQKTAASGTAQDQLQQLENQLAELREKQMQLSKEAGGLSVARNGLDTDTLPIREQLLGVQEAIADALHRSEIAQLTCSLLEQAKLNLSTSYLPKLRTRLQQLLSEVTGDNYQIDLDSEFNFKVYVNGVSKPLESFSRGIREIVLLCFRVALSELLFDGHIPFMIVDDAFVNFDEQNFVRATNLLKNIAQAGGQVVYFTCHDRLGNLK